MGGGGGGGRGVPYIVRHPSSDFVLLNDVCPRAEPNYKVLLVAQVPQAQEGKHCVTTEWNYL